MDKSDNFFKDKIFEIVYYDSREVSPFYHKTKKKLQDFKYVKLKFNRINMHAKSFTNQKNVNCPDMQLATE